MKPVVLSVGVIRPASGYGRLFRSVLAHLSTTYDVHHLGTDHLGERVEGSGWTLHPVDGRTDVDGCRAIAALGASLRPAVVVIINDLWKVQPAIQAARRWAAGAAIVVSCPVDGEIIDAALVDFLPLVARFVVYTGAARATVEEAIRSRFGPVGDELLARIAVVPNGVDRSAFYPLVAAEGGAARSRGSLLARRQLFPDRPDVWDSFIVLNASMNQGRKRLDLSLAGFADFARDRPPSVRLLIHSRWRDWACDVDREGERLGIAGRLLRVWTGEGLPAVSDDVLNLVYNAAEVGLTTSLGEGWGFTTLEHAATGAAQIVPRHSALAEVWRDAAEFVEPAERFAPPGAPLAFAAVTAGDVARSLRRLHDDPARLREVSAACFRAATRPDYGWAAVAARWDALLRTVLDGRG